MKKTFVCLCILILCVTGCGEKAKKASESSNKPKAPLQASAAPCRINWLGYIVKVTNTSTDKTITNFTLTVTDYAKYAVSNGKYTYSDPRSVTKSFTSDLKPGASADYNVEKPELYIMKYDVSFSNVLASDETAWDN